MTSETVFSSPLRSVHRLCSHEAQFSDVRFVSQLLEARRSGDTHTQHVALKLAADVNYSDADNSREVALVELFEIVLEHVVEQDLSLGQCSAVLAITRDVVTQYLDKQKERTRETFERILVEVIMPYCAPRVVSYLDTETIEEVIEVMPESTAAATNAKPAAGKGKAQQQQPAEAVKPQKQKVTRTVQVVRESTVPTTFSPLEVHSLVHLLTTAIFHHSTLYDVMLPRDYQTLDKVVVTQTIEVPALTRPLSGAMDAATLSLYRVARGVMARESSVRIRVATNEAETFSHIMYEEDTLRKEQLSREAAARAEDERCAMHPSDVQHVLRTVMQLRSHRNQQRPGSSTSAASSSRVTADPHHPGGTEDQLEQDLLQKVAKLETQINTLATQQPTRK
eukprot:PhM_4_TR9587/c0_g1_i1/m.31396